MYALSQPRKAAFIYDPRAGLEIPLVAEFARKAIFVEYPDVEDLEADFVHFPDLMSLRAAARGHLADIDRLVRFGKKYSRQFADLIRNDDCTLDEIARRIMAAEAKGASPGGVEFKTYSGQDEGRSSKSAVAESRDG